jgi:hypothetical protein
LVISHVVVALGMIEISSLSRGLRHSNKVPLCNKEKYIVSMPFHRHRALSPLFVPALLLNPHPINSLGGLRESYCDEPEFTFAMEE